MNKIQSQPFFSKKEIERAINKELINYNALNFLTTKLNKFRMQQTRKITILDINKGNHIEGSQHYLSKAVDIYIDGAKQKDLDGIVKNALSCGFKGIGVYKNASGVYSFHLDLRDSLALWRGTKKGIERNWTYDNLIKV